MSDLISRSALIEHIKDVPTWIVHDKNPRKYPVGMYDPEDVISSIENAPTVDAVEVIRCKDCCWYQEDGSICVNSHCTKSYYGCRVRKDHFCSYGERRNDE